MLLFAKISNIFVSISIVLKHLTPIKTNFNFVIDFYVDITLSSYRTSTKKLSNIGFDTYLEMYEIEPNSLFM